MKKLNYILIGITVVSVIALCIMTGLFFKVRNQYNKLIEKTGNYWFSIDGENIEQQQTKVDSDFLFYEEGQ